MMRPSKILLQRVSTFETRAILYATSIGNRRIDVERLDTADLDNHQADLASGNVLPVGDVQFIRRAFDVAGIEPPEPMSYPQGIDHLLHRRVTRSTLGAALAMTGPTFIKPVETKLFTGYVNGAGDANGHQAEQLALAAKCPLDTPVWTSDVVRFVCEWRYYVQGKLIIGEARYDPDGHEDAPLPNRFVVSNAIVSLHLPHPYTMDFGVLEDGQTALIECNDAWAVGLYDHALAPSAYLSFLWARWQSLKGKAV